MAEVSAVKIPPYNYSDPALWFILCESTFELGTPKAITDSKTKYNYVVSHIPPDAASLVRDILLDPGTEDPYGKVKEELIKRSGETSHQEIRKLLTGEQLGDRKPSDLLRVMQRRASKHNVPDQLMLELFLQNLPTQVQTVLTAVTPLTIEKAAEIADRVLDVAQISVSACSTPSFISIEDKLLGEIKKLNLRIDNLSRGRSQSRNRSFSRERSKSNNRNHDLCWYHFKFGEKAVNCKPFCKFAKKNENGQE